MTGEGEEGEELTSVDEVPFQRRSRDKNINNYLRILMLKNRSVMLAQVWTWLNKLLDTAMAIFLMKGGKVKTKKKVNNLFKCF